MQSEPQNDRPAKAMQDGHVSAISTEAEVVYQKWDSVNDCPTLELLGRGSSLKVFSR